MGQGFCCSFTLCTKQRKRKSMKPFTICSNYVQIRRIKQVYDLSTASFHSEIKLILYGKLHFYSFKATG